VERKPFCESGSLSYTQYQSATKSQNLIEETSSHSNS
jgi:hypothetical protein